MVDAHDDVAVAGQVASLRGVERGGGAAAVGEQDHGVLAARGGRAAGRRAGDAVEGSGGELVGDLDVGLLGAGQDVGRAGAWPRTPGPDLAQRQPARPAARDGEPFGAVMVGQRETLKTNRRSAGRGRRGDGSVAAAGARSAPAARTAIVRSRMRAGGLGCAVVDRNATGFGGPAWWRRTMLAVGALVVGATGNVGQSFPGTERADAAAVQRP